MKVSPEEPAITKEDEDVIHTLNKKIKNLENGSTKSSDLKAKDIHNDKSVKVSVLISIFVVFVIRMMTKKCILNSSPDND